MTMLSAPTMAMRTCSSQCAPRAVAARPLQLPGRQASTFRTLLSQRQPARLSVCRQIACSAQAAEQGTLISKVEVPAFIPRADLCEQLMRWALGNAQDDGLANFGLPMRVTAHEGPDGIQDGYIVDIVRDGRTVSQIGVLFDNEVTAKHEFVGRGSDGFPTLEGKVMEIRGKHLTIRKLDDQKVDEELRSVIRAFCEGLVAALNKYYAFGSCFTDDTT